MRYISILVISVILLCGCAKVEHLDQLLTLKSLSDNQAQQTKLVESRDKKFGKLLEAIKSNRLSEYPDKKSVFNTFGEPIFIKKTVKDEKPIEKWLYRCAVKMTGSEKVYLYFDDAGKLVDSLYVKPEAKEKREDANNKKL